MSNSVIDLIVDSDHLRLDTYIQQQDIGLSRSRIKNLIIADQVLVNGNSCKVSQSVCQGDLITINILAPKPSGNVPVDIPLDVIFEDEHIMVINKQAGLPVHPGPGHESDTMVNAILHVCPDLAGIGDEIRPGIVHRLDKDTSGLIVVAKTEQALNHLSDQMKNRSTDKQYIALVMGHMPKSSGIINLPIGRHPKDRKKMAVVENGREAITEFEVLEVCKDMSLLKLKLHTGRTHQIRVHLAYMGCKILGDLLYGGKSPMLDRQFLHASRMQIIHPHFEAPQVFVAELPTDLTEIVRDLGFDKSRLTL